MATATQSARGLRHLAVTVDLRAISLSEGIRAGLSVAAILGLAELLGLAPLREAALAALLTCLCDPGGPIRRRGPMLLTFAVLGAAVLAGFGVLRALGPVVAVGVGTIGLFAASFARVYGQPAQQLGALLSVVMILSLDYPITSLHTASYLAAAFFGGALWATLLTLVIWRIYPYAPAQRAVADTYRRLSFLVRELHALARSDTAVSADWDAHARARRSELRDAIEKARAIVVDTLRAHGTGNNRAAQSLLRLETADQIFGSLLALSDRMERDEPNERAAAAPVLRRLRPLLLTFARIIVTDDPHAHRRVARSIDAIARDAAAIPAGSTLRAIVDRIGERLRIAHTMAVPANFDPGVTLGGQQLPWRQRVLAPLRDNLSLRSATMLHALRIVIVAFLALSYTMVRFNPYDHWLTITVVATMQPYFALTLSRAIERVLGTAAGGMIAAGVGMVYTTPLSMAAAIFPLAVGALAVRAVSFGLFMMALTPLVVLLVETGRPTAAGWEIAMMRAALTAAGGIIAVGANALLWPHREPALLAPSVRSAILAHAQYADAAFADLLAPGLLTRTVSRRAAGLASNALEAQISRVLVHPGRSSHDQLEAALVVDAALRRLAGRIAAMALDPQLAAAPPEELGLWRAWISDSLTALGRGATTVAPRPSTGETDALSRIARQIELMAGTMERLPQAA